MQPEEAEIRFAFHDQDGRTIKVKLRIDFGKDVTYLNYDRAIPAAENEDRPAVGSQTQWFGDRKNLLDQLTIPLELTERDVVVKLTNCQTNAWIGQEKPERRRGDRHLELPREAYETIVALLKHTNYMP